MNRYPEEKISQAVTLYKTGISSRKVAKEFGVNQKTVLLWAWKSGFHRTLSESQSGIYSHRFGKHLSDETKRKMSIAQKGKRISDEHRKNLRTGKDIFYYLDNKTVFLDKENICLADSYSWYINTTGYLVRHPKLINGNYEKIERFLHRVIISAKKGQIVDHINRNRLDNRKTNLRIVTSTQNSLNKTLKLNKTGRRGVVKVGNKFRASIGINNKQKHLGYFKNIEDADKAYRKEYEKQF